MPNPYDASDPAQAGYAALWDEGHNAARELPPHDPNDLGCPHCGERCDVCVDSLIETTALARKRDELEAQLKARQTMLDTAHAQLDMLGAPRFNDEDLPPQQSVAERIEWFRRERLAKAREELHAAPHSDCCRVHLGGMPQPCNCWRTKVFGLLREGDAPC